MLVPPDFGTGELEREEGECGNRRDLEVSSHFEVPVPDMSTLKSQTPLQIDPDIETCRR